MAVSEIHQDVVNTHAVVSGLEHSVRDIHRTIVGGQRGNGDNNSLVSDSQVSQSGHCQMTTRHCAGSNQVSDPISMGPLSNIQIQRAWRNPAFAAKNFLRTRRVDWEGGQPGRELCSDRSHRCRRNWQNIYRPHYSPSRSYQATVWPRSTVHPLRPIPSLTCPSPPPAFRCHWSRCRKSRRFNPPAGIPVLEGDVDRP